MLEIYYKFVVNKYDNNLWNYLSVDFIFKYVGSINNRAGREREIKISLLRAEIMRINK